MTGKSEGRERQAGDPLSRKPRVERDRLAMHILSMRLFILYLYKLLKYNNYHFLIFIL